MSNPLQRAHGQGVSIVEEWVSEKNQAERFVEEGKCRRLGSVFAGSGLFTVQDSESCILDWALITVNPERETNQTYVSLPLS